jgi:hypothetical protein
MTNLARSTELSCNELDGVCGGIIIVSGLQHFELSYRTSVLDKVALNPQPLPPKSLSFTHR